MHELMQLISRYAVPECGLHASVRSKVCLFAAEVCRSQDQTQRAREWFVAATTLNARDPKVWERYAAFEDDNGNPLLSQVW